MDVIASVALTDNKCMDVIASVALTDNKCMDVIASVALTVVTSVWMLLPVLP